MARHYRQTLVVGDIQGCFNGLMRLLKKADFDPNKDKLCAVGDLVARGEDSLATVEFLMSLGKHFTTVLGNHDLHLLAVTQGIRKSKRSDNLDNLLASKRLPEIVDWLRQFPLAQQLNNNTLLVHAGLYPKWSFKKVVKLSNEVSSELKGKHWRRLLENMYGSEPTQWQGSHEGYDRLRFIINACTRMRFLYQSDLSLEFATKTAVNDAPTDLTPWFSVENSHIKSDHMVLFGHWAALSGQTNQPHLQGLDTGYVWGQSMTGYRLEDGKRISVSHN